MDGNLVQSNFINSVFNENVICKNVKRMQCYQGAMMIGKVFCTKCKGELGLRFVMDQSSIANETTYFRNSHQYGRYVLFGSATVSLDSD